MLSKMLLKNSRVSKNVNKISQGQMSGYFDDNADNKIDAWNVNKQMHEMETDGTLGFDWSNPLASIETAVNDLATEYIPENVKSQIDAQLKVEADKQVANLTNQAMVTAKNLITAKTNDPETQNQAIASTVSATVEQATQTLIGVKEAFRLGGVKGLYDKYPIPFYIGGGLVGLGLVKWTLGQIGKGKYKAVMSQAKANPRKKRRTKKRK
jgi:hypothetical protein